MYCTTEYIVNQGWSYINPMSRYYRLLERDDLVDKADLPWEFVDSNKRVSSKLNRAFKPDGPATQLFTEIERPYLYTLHAAQLHIPKKYDHARCIRKQDALSVWRVALRERFTGVWFYKLEVGLEEVLHVHVVADEWAGLPELRRGSELCKPIRKGDEKKVMRYLAKPPCYPTTKRVDEYLRAKKRVGGARLPEVSGYVGLPSKRERLFLNGNRVLPSETLKLSESETSCIYRAIGLETKAHVTNTTGLADPTPAQMLPKNELGLSHIAVATALQREGVDIAKIALCLNKEQSTLTQALVSSTRKVSA